MFTPLMVHALIQNAQDAAAAAAAGPAAPAASPAPISGAERGACPGWGGGGGKGADTGALTVLLTAIPFSCASIVHLLNCLHSSRTQERKLHIAVPWALGAAAMLALPLAWSRLPALGFMLLVLCNVGVNGANAVQTGWLVALLQGPQRALGLPLYNTGARAHAPVHVH